VVGCSNEYIDRTHGNNWLRDRDIYMRGTNTYRPKHRKTETERQKERERVKERKRGACTVSISRD